MLSKSTVQHLEWIDNNPEDNPVINEKTSVTFKFLGIPFFKRALEVTHTGEYSSKDSSNNKRADGAPIVKGFK